MLYQDFSNKTDEELVALTIESQDVFAHLINRYEKKLSRYIRRIAGLEQEEIEDLLQNIFIKVYRNLNDFDPELKFSSWIYRIAHNEVISHYRQKQRRPNHNPGEENDWELLNIESDFNIEKETNNKLLRKNIEDVLNRMESKYREVLVLKYFEEKDYQEISDILKKPMGTVATLLNRAKKEFKKAIEKNNLQI